MFVFGSSADRHDVATGEAVANNRDIEIERRQIAFHDAAYGWHTKLEVEDRGRRGHAAHHPDEYDGSGVRFRS